MSARWLTIRVDLVSGRGQAFDPPPGRVFAVPPSATFEDLGLAIDQAFGRWDLAHLRSFTLANGTEVSDPETNDEALESSIGPIPKTMPLTARVSRTVRDGDSFGYLFDFGDQWTHACAVEGREDPSNPQQDRPVITWGWGSLPDQYGRRWADDDGSSEPPPRDEAGVTAHDQHRPDPIDLRAFRIAIHADDPAQLVDVITGVDLDDALQQVGSGLLRTQLGASPRDRQVLAPYLAVLKRGAAPEAVPVDLEELISDQSIEGEEPGVYVNTKTGETAPIFATDSAIVGEDVVVDVESDDWILLDEDDSHDRWQDLAAFAASQQPEFRALLEQAIQGKGAFARFRQAVHQAGVNGRWTAFSDDRRIGRARAALARHGVRAI